MMKLTAKQEQFSQYIADGNDQATAYRKAYDAENMKNSVIYSKASALMADGKVTVRVSELKAQLADQQLWTREMSRNNLINALRVAEAARSPAGMIAAIRELNLTHGFNEPEKVSFDLRFTPLRDCDWL